MIYTEHKTANQIFIDVYKFNDAQFIVHCIPIFPGIHLWYNTNGLVLKSSQFFKFVLWVDPQMWLQYDR